MASLPVYLSRLAGPPAGLAVELVAFRAEILRVTRTACEHRMRPRGSEPGGPGWGLDAASLTGSQGLPLLLLGGALDFGDHCSRSPNPGVTT